MLKKSLLIAFLLINLYAAVNVLSSGTYCDYIRINLTNSLPFYVFYSSPLDNIERGMYVSLVHPLSSRQLFKQIVGLPGDQINIQDQHIFLNGKDYGYVHPISSSGMSLSAIAEVEIPDGFVFVYAIHPKSFDSRYAEFGLVAMEQLKGQLWPIF
jgi:conjugal transfer pilin signal peptidase TrbI